MKGITIWAQDEDVRRHFTVCGYLWPHGKDKILDMKFFVQHVTCMDEHEAKTIGIAQARRHARMTNDDPAVAFAVFAGHLDELSWTAFIPPSNGNAAA